jgi:hypothetical protein
MLKSGMDRRSLIRAASYAVLMAPLLGLSSCLGRQFTPFRYRLSLYVTKGGRIYSGSSVVEVHQGVTQTIDDGNLWTATFKGEATLVDLGNDEVLLGLLTGNLPWQSNPTFMLADLYGVNRRPGAEGAFIDELSQKRGVLSLAPEQMPTLITFNDVNDPASYVRVDPTDPGLTLGAAVTNISATIEITDVPVTRGLRKRLKWLKSTHYYLNGQRGGRSADVHVTQLIQGI